MGRMGKSLASIPEDRAQNNHRSQSTMPTNSSPTSAKRVVSGAINWTSDDFASGSSLSTASSSMSNASSRESYMNFNSGKKRLDKERKHAKTRSNVRLRASTTNYKQKSQMNVQVQKIETISEEDENTNDSSSSSAKHIVSEILLSGLEDFLSGSTATSSSGSNVNTSIRGSKPYKKRSISGKERRQNSRERKVNNNASRSKISSPVLPADQSVTGIQSRQGLKETVSDILSSHLDDYLSSRSTTSVSSSRSSAKLRRARSNLKAFKIVKKKNAAKLKSIEEESNEIKSPNDKSVDRDDKQLSDSPSNVSAKIIVSEILSSGLEDYLSSKSSSSGTKSNITFRKTRPLSKSNKSDQRKTKTTKPEGTKVEFSKARRQKERKSEKGSNIEERSEKQKASKKHVENLDKNVIKSDAEKNEREISDSPSNVSANLITSEILSSGLEDFLSSSKSSSSGSRTNAFRKKRYVPKQKTDEKKVKKSIKQSSKLAKGQNKESQKRTTDFSFIKANKNNEEEKPLSESASNESAKLIVSDVLSSGLEDFLSGNSTSGTSKSSSRKSRHVFKPYKTDRKRISTDKPKQSDQEQSSLKETYSAFDAERPETPLLEKDSISRDKIVKIKDQGIQESLSNLSARITNSDIFYGVDDFLSATSTSTSLLSNIGPDLKEIRQELQTMQPSYGKHMSETSADDTTAVTTSTSDLEFALHINDSVKRLTSDVVNSALTDIGIESDADLYDQNSRTSGTLQKLKETETDTPKNKPKRVLKINHSFNRQPFRSCYSYSSFERSAADFLTKDSSEIGTAGSETSMPQKQTHARIPKSKSESFKSKQSVLQDHSHFKQIQEDLLKAQTVKQKQESLIKISTDKRSAQQKSEKKTTLEDLDKEKIKGRKSPRKSKHDLPNNIRKESIKQITDVLLKMGNDETEKEKYVRKGRNTSTNTKAVEKTIKPIIKPAKVLDFEEKFNKPGKKKFGKLKHSQKRSDSFPNSLQKLEPVLGAVKSMSISSSVPLATENLLKKIEVKDGWKTELSESQLAAFRLLFSRFDQTQSGGISAKELYQAITELLPDMNVPYNLVESVLKEFDIKETGEIEFDEFIFAMTNPKNYLKLIQDDDRDTLEKEIKIWEDVIHKSKPVRNGFKKKTAANGDFNVNDSGRNLFFKMLKTATKKDSMKEIRHFYVNRIKKLNDHVIHDWSAGQRCIGLSHQEMAKRYDHINRELKDKKSPFASKEYTDSPYAQPLRWGFEEEEWFKRKNSKNYGKGQFRGRAKSAGARLKSQKDMFNRPKSAKHVDSCISEIQEIQFKEETDEAQDYKPITRERTKKNTRFNLSDDVLQRTYSAPTGKAQKIVQVKARAASAKKRTAPLRRPRISEFVVTPKVVPLPKYYLKNYPQTFNYDQLPEIRQKTAVILEDYYSDLKKVAATNSKTIYKQLQVEQMLPLMRCHFKQSYQAYSGDFEPFVVSPWIPYPRPSPWIPYPPLGKSQPKSAWN